MAHFVDFGESAELFRPSLKTIFNGFNLDDELTDENGSFMTLSVSGRNDSEYDITTHDVPGLDGVIEEGNPTLNPRIISVRFRIKADTSTHLQRKFEKLRSLLEGSKKELSFTDDEFFFYATNQSLEIPDETSNSLTSVITFLCSDPYKYGSEKVLGFPSDLVMVNNEGTTEAFPIYEMTVTAPITFAMIQNHLEESMLIGELAEAVNEIVDTRTLLLEERGQTLETWTSSGTSVDGTVSGNLGTDNDGITVPSYGADVPNWHGPALMKEIEPAQDFEVEMMLEGEATGNMTYRIEFYLFDENMNVLGKMAIKDQALGASKKDAEGRIGPFLGRGENYLISSQNYSYNWTFFFGMLRLRRVGNHFEFYVTRVANNTKHVYSFKKSFTDIDNEYAGRLKFVQIHIGKYGDTPRANAPKIHHIKVTELSQATVDQTPYIAYPGDVITFDTQTEEMLINGEDVMTEKAFISDFFTLKKGENTLAILPEDSLEVEMRYRERRK